MPAQSAHLVSHIICYNGMVSALCINKAFGAPERSALRRGNEMPSVKRLCQVSALHVGRRNTGIPLCSNLCQVSAPQNEILSNAGASLRCGIISMTTVEAIS